MSGCPGIVRHMASNDELDARLTAVERRIQAIREDAAAARILAGGADRDVSAMHDTLRGHTAKLDSHAAKLDSHTTKLDSHTAKLDMHKVLLESLRETQVEQGAELIEIRRVLTSVAVGQAEIVALLSRPEDPEPTG